MTGEVIRIGSRGSDLALRQAHWVRERMMNRRLQIDVVVIKTTGDRITDAPVSGAGSKGIFIKELEEALLEKRIDIAVHSLKDLPADLPEGLALGAVTKREDVRDVFIAHPRKPYRRLEDVPRGSRIATGSLRRKCQLLHWRRDLEIVDVRGNLPTRLAKLEESEWDGMVLARAGLVRLGIQDRVTEILPLDRMLPAVGQGALAVEIRADDRMTRKAVAPVHDETTATATTSERSLLRCLEGGCQVPVAACGRLEGDLLFLDALVGSVDGRNIVRGKTHGDAQSAEELGVTLGQMLLKGGARRILESIRGSFTVPAI